MRKSSAKQKRQVAAIRSMKDAGIDLSEMPEAVDWSGGVVGKFYQERRRANAVGREMQAGVPRAMSARYDRRLGRVVIELSNRLMVAFAPGDAQGLERATEEELEPVEISPSGFGLHFPKLDADLYVPALLEGLLGSRKWMASRMGAAGGQSRSRAKRSAAKKNGRLGGAAEEDGGVMGPGLKARAFIAQSHAARLKSCPDTKRALSRYPMSPTAGDMGHPRSAAKKNGRLGGRPRKKTVA